MTCYRNGGCGPYEMYSCAECPASKKEYVETKAYQRGLNDAWEAARKIGGIGESAIPCEDLRRLFGVDAPCYIFRDTSSYDAVQIILEYEAQKKAEEEIKVGDEIEYEYFGVTKGVVISKYEEENRVGYKVLCANGCGQLIYANTAMPRKTGRHFPQIAEVLKQMQGE